MMPPPRLVAWETTRACNLACRHCRAEAILTPGPDELSHEEGLGLLRQLAAWKPSPMVILTGGEPLMRSGIIELAAYGTGLGLRMLISPNGTLVNAKNAEAMKKAGIARASLSLDGPDAASHDAFRGVPGAFEGLVQGAAYLREAGLPFQINSTLTAENLKDAEALTEITQSLGAVAHHVFLLVPTGRAAGQSSCLSAEAYEEALKGLKAREASLNIDFKATCAPQYQRIGRQMGLSGGGHSGRGCLGGQGFMFISSEGRCQSCGYLPLAAGNVREQKIVDIYEHAPIFKNMRDKAAYHGKCGRCEFWPVCGGCRARAHAEGDYLGPEPLCPYQQQEL